MIFNIFEKTKSYKVKKESFAELKNCYEKITGEYISTEDFKYLLISYGVKGNKKDNYKLKMKPEIRKWYFNI